MAADGLSKENALSPTGFEQQDYVSSKVASIERRTLAADTRALIFGLCLSYPKKVEQPGIAQLGPCDGIHTLGHGPSVTAAWVTVSS